VASHKTVIKETRNLCDAAAKFLKAEVDFQFEEDFDISQLFARKVPFCNDEPLDTCLLKECINTIFPV
jgi:hypothetical protein